MSAALTAALQPPVTLPRAIGMAGVVAAAVLVGAATRWGGERPADARAVVWLQPVQPPPAPAAVAPPPPAPVTERRPPSPPVSPPKSEERVEPRPKPLRPPRTEPGESARPVVVQSPGADTETSREAVDTAATTPSAKSEKDAAAAAPSVPPASADASVSKGPVDATVACAHRVRPKMPEETDEDVPGVEVVVVAEATLKDGRVTDVRILSGPRRYHLAARQAMLQYSQCQARPGQAILQEFRFTRNGPQEVPKL